MKNIGIILVLAALLITGCISSKRTKVQGPPAKIAEAKTDVERYLLKYYPVAVELMEEHKIPASITLAQAVLEGGAGRSKLVADANNHFGIKAGSRWKGRTVTAYDNGKWCEFRAYKNTLESYEDHSNFLLVNNRYKFLFDLKITDYKGWAKGLKKAGYAEDKEYDKKLIRIIERYGLNELDGYTSDMAGTDRSGGDKADGYRADKKILKTNGLSYVVADDGDTFASLAREFGISERKLKKYNDIYRERQIQEGDIIYLEKKNNKAGRNQEFHTADYGESLHSISQKYGIRLSAIYDMNPQYRDYARLKKGDVIRLR